MPEVPTKTPYETEVDCPQCAMDPPPKLICVIESIFVGNNITRHLECPRCLHRVQDVVSATGQVILSKELEKKRLQKQNR